MWCCLTNSNNLCNHITIGIKAARLNSPLTSCRNYALRLTVNPCEIQQGLKANCVDPCCKSKLLKRVEHRPQCVPDFSLLHGDCNPGDASANGRKPEPDTGIKVGGADGWKCSTSTCQAIHTIINYMFTAGCGSLRQLTFCLMSAAHYHI